MKTEQIIILIVAFFLGMLLLNTIKGVCGCDLVEGQGSDCETVNDIKNQLSLCKNAKGDNVLAGKAMSALVYNDILDTNSSYRRNHGRDSLAAGGFWDKLKARPTHLGVNVDTGGDVTGGCNYGKLMEKDDGGDGPYTNIMTELLTAQSGTTKVGAFCPSPPPPPPPPHPDQL